LERLCGVAGEAEAEVVVVVEVVGWMVESSVEAREVKLMQIDRRSLRPISPAKSSV